LLTKVIIDNKVKFSKEFYLVSLLIVKLLYRYKVLKGLIVRKDLNKIYSTYKLKFLGLKGVDNSKKLFIIYKIVILY